MQIPGVHIWEPQVHRDHRGAFFELFNQKVLKELGVSFSTAQMNVSHSRHGAVRGLHFQKGEHAQAKCVTAMDGTIRDIILDMRPESDAFGHVMTIDLDAQRPAMVYVPAGCAHGFAALSEEVTVLYAVDQPWCASAEGCVHWNDADLAIHWGVDEDQVHVSDKDALGLSWQEYRQELMPGTNTIDNHKIGEPA